MIKVISCYFILMISITLSIPRQYSLKPSLMKTLLANLNVPRLSIHTTYNERKMYNGERRQAQTLDQRHKEEMEDRLWDLEWKKHANRVAKLRAGNEERMFQKWELDQKKARDEWLKEKEKVSQEREVWVKKQEKVRQKNIALQAAEEMASQKKEEVEWDITEEFSGQKETAIKESEKLTANAEEKVIKEKNIEHKRNPIFKAEVMTNQEQKSKVEALKEALIKKQEKFLQVAVKSTSPRDVKEKEAWAMKEDILGQKQSASRKKKEMVREEAEARLKAIQEAEELTKKNNKLDRKASVVQENTKLLWENNKHERLISVTGTSEQTTVVKKANRLETMVKVSTAKQILKKPANSSNEDFFFRIGKYEHDNSLAYDLDEQYGHGLRVPWE